MDLRLSGDNRRAQNGKKPTISVNNDGTVVEMHQVGTLIPYLYYSVGIFQEDMTTISWGRDISLLDKGKNAKIVINNNDNVVEVHQSEGLFKNLWYRVGKMNRSRKEIDWRLGDAEYFGTGNYPAVALSNEGRVVIVYQSAHGSAECFYLIGQLDPVNPHSITFNSDGSLPLFPDVRGGVSQPSVAINGLGWLIFAGRVTSNHRIIFKVARLIENNNDETAEFVWLQNVDIQQMNSDSPSIALNDSGHVISVQKSSRNTYRVGKIECEGDELKNIKWNGDKKNYRSGDVATIAISNDGKYVVEEHEDGGHLYYCVCCLH